MPRVTKKKKANTPPNLDKINLGTLSGKPQEFIDLFKGLPVYETREDVRELINGVERELDDISAQADVLPDAGEIIITELCFKLQELLKKDLASPDDPPLTSDQERLKQSFVDQHVEMTTALTNFGITETPDLRGTKHPIPTWDQIKSRFTPEKLEAISELNTPTLLLVPMGHKDKEIIERIDANKKVPGQKDTYRNDEFNNVKYFPDETTCKVTTQGASTTYEMEHEGGKTRDEVRQSLETAPQGMTVTPGWMVVVVEGPEEMPPDTISKDPKKRWGQKVEELVKQLNKNLKDGKRKFEGFIPEVTLILQMLGLSKTGSDGEPAPIIFDKQTYNALLGMAFTDSKNLPCSVWNVHDHQLYLAEDDPGPVHARLRGRRLVVL